MSSLREKYKQKVNANSLKAQDDKLEELRPTNKNNSGYVGFHDIDEGKNRFRLYPGHLYPNGEPAPFIFPQQRYFLPIEMDKRGNDGKVVNGSDGKPERVIRRKAVFDARVHSDKTLGGRKMDIVDEYIKFLNKVLDESGMSDEEKKEKLWLVHGNFYKKINGIVDRPSWVTYADKVFPDGSKKFARLSMGKAIKNGLNAALASETSEEPIGTESMNPFTDPEDGRILFITKDSEAGKQDPGNYYLVSISSDFNKQTKMIKLAPLSEQDLVAFEEKTPLFELYENSYTQHDFDLAIEGLINFDKEHNFGVLEYEEFIEMIDQLREIYSEKEEKREVAKNESPESSNESSSEDEDKPYAQLDRDALKKEIKARKLPVMIKQNISDQALRDILIDDDFQEETFVGKSEKKSPEPENKDSMEDYESDLPFDKEEEETEEAPKAEEKKEEVKEEESPKKSSRNARSKLDELRKKVNKK